MGLFRMAAAVPVMFALGLAAPTGASAGEPSVLDATAIANPNGTYSISATIAHGDEGWKHYADAFEVLDGRGASWQPASFITHTSTSSRSRARSRTFRSRSD